MFVWRQTWSAISLRLITRRSTGPATWLSRLAVLACLHPSPTSQAQALFQVDGDASVEFANFEGRSAVFNGDLTVGDGGISLLSSAQFTTNGTFVAGVTGDVYFNANDTTSAFHFNGLTSFNSDFNVTANADVFNTGRLQIRQQWFAGRYGGL